MTDPVSPEGLREDLAAFASLLEAEWYNGNLDEKAYERLNGDLTGIVAKHRAALRDTGSRPDSGIDDLYRALVSEHGHDERHEAVWPECLPVHMAMNRYRLSTPRTETSDGLLDAERDALL